MVVQMLVASHPPGYDDAIGLLLARIDYERVPPRGYRTREYKLDRMRDLLSRLDDPQRQLKVVHIAGTKGKGSTAAMLASMAAAAGLRVGAFTSPHLDRVEERIAINGEACSPLQLVELVQDVRPVVEAMDIEASRLTSTAEEARGPTYFELTTALALLHFARQQVDLAVLEVGLGGRLDSTNVCQPLCTAITSISYDHTRQLGNTLTKIAAEKAGIIKDGVPVVSGVTLPLVSKVIADRAAEHGAELVQRGADFDFTYHPPQDRGRREAAGELAGSRLPEGDRWCGSMDYRAGQRGGGRSFARLRLSLPGRHQAANAAVALALVGVLERQGFSFPESAIRQGLSSTICPARIELLQQHPTIVVDAAHNASSIESLVEVLDECFPVGDRALIFASTVGKDLPGMLNRLVPHFDQIFVTRYVNNPRGVPVEQLAVLVQRAAAAAGSRVQNVTVCHDPSTAWEAVQSSVPIDGLICVTGSFFIAAEMRRLIDPQAGRQACGLPVPVPPLPVASRDK